MGKMPPLDSQRFAGHSSSLSGFAGHWFEVGRGVLDRRLAVLLLSGRVGPNPRVWREGFPGPCDDGKSWVPVAALLGVQPKWFTEADAV